MESSPNRKIGKLSLSTVVHEVNLLLCFCITARLAENEIVNPTIDAKDSMVDGVDGLHTNGEIEMMDSFGS